MKLRTLVIAMSAVAGMSLAPAAFSQTCSTAAWGQGGNPTVTPTVGAPVPGGPLATPTAIPRYSGRCGLRAPTGAGNYVQDSSPAAEPTFRARFYAFLAGTGTSNIFRAGNQADALTSITAASSRILVEWNGSNTITARGPGGSPTLTCSGLTAGRWYSIELGYNSTASALGSGVTGVPANSMRLRVQNETAAPIDCNQVSTGGVPTAAANNIDFVQLGNLSGGSSGAVIVDSYESRRTTPIGRLCRGDANASNTITAGDAQAIINEFVNGNLATGQADCNENGAITAGDAQCVLNRFTNGENC
jgi:hypothetical protein